MKKIERDVQRQSVYKNEDEERRETKKREKETVSAPGEGQSRYLTVDLSVYCLSKSLLMA